MKIMYIAIFLCFSMITKAQVSFEEGYFINNQGQKINCFIRNTDKEANPINFQYRISENDDIKTATIDSVSAFEILNTGHKYFRSKVNIEISGSNINHLKDENDIVFKEEVLFLRVLIESKASLFVFVGISGTEKYFYSIAHKNIEPLIHYVYQGKGSDVKENNRFRHQLYTDLKCSSLSQRNFERLQYNQTELMRIFNRYSECQNADKVITQKKKAENQLDVIFGIGTSVLELEQKAQTSAPSFGGMVTNFVKERTNRRLTPVIGFSYTHVFPFNNGALGFFIEPAYQAYKNKLKDIAIPSGEPVMLEINYSYLTLPLGIKRSFYLNDHSKIFLKGGVGWNLVLNSSKVFGPGSTYRKVNGLRQDGFDVTPYMLLSAGFLANDKFSLGAEFTSNRTLLDNVKYKARLVNNFTVLLGYRLW